MKTWFPAARMALLLTAALGAASCERKAEPAPQTPPQEAAMPASASDQLTVSFGDGFQKEEATPTATLRWVRQDAILRVAAPTEGRYRLMFRPVTVFSSVENTIEVRVGGQSVGKFSTHASDLSSAVPAPVEVHLRAGSNEMALHSTQPEVRLGESDERLAAFGLLLPIGVERLP